jgi:hypothetical protein
MKMLIPSYTTNIASTYMMCHSNQKREIASQIRAWPLFGTTTMALKYM